MIEKVELLQKGLLDPVQSLEKAFDMTIYGTWSCFCGRSYYINGDDNLGRPNAMGDVEDSFDKLDNSVRGFAQSPHQDFALYLDKVNQWARFTRVSKSTHSICKGLIFPRKGWMG